MPDDVGFAIKPQLAASDDRACHGRSRSIPLGPTADTVYGVGDGERDLRRAGKGYALGVAANHAFHSWGKAQPVSGTAAEIVKTLQPSDWKRLSAGTGTKAPRLHDW